MSNSILYFLAVVALGVTVFGLDAIMRRPWRGIYLVAGAEFAGMLVAPDFGVDFFGFRVSPRDAVLVILGAVVLTRFLRGVRPTRSVQFLVAVLALALWSIARGALEFSLAQAVNEGRTALYFLVVTLFAAGLPFDERSRRALVRAWVGFSVALVAVALARWAIVLGGLPGRGFWYTPEYGGLRVLWSDETLVLAQATLLLLPRIARGDAAPWEIRVCAATGAAVLVLQHRSVWAVLLTGALLVLWRCRRVLNRRLVAIAGTLGMALLAFTITTLDSSEVVEDVGRADAIHTGTFEWRVAGWRVLAASAGPQTPAEVVTGRPYGGGWERTLDDGVVTDAPPHNMYLELLLRLGVAGAGLLLVTGVRAARLLRRRPDDRGHFDTTALLALLASQAVYAIPYYLSMVQGLVLGTALAALASGGRAPEANAQDLPADPGAVVVRAR